VRATPGTLASLLFASGAAAFVYELAWARWLTLTLGASAEGLAIVTSSTMVGFALGAGAIAPRIDASARPLRSYGLLELGIGASAGLVSLVLDQAPTAAWSSDLPRPALVVGLVMVIAIPTALMGATLPAAVAAAGGGDERAMRGQLSRLYAANTAGAVLGTLAMGFFLVEHLGYARAAGLGCAASVLVGAVAIALDRRAPARALHVKAVGDAPTTRAPHRVVALAVAATSGFAVLAHEVLASRLLVYGLFATAHALAILLAAYLAGLAIGARLVAGPLARGEAGPVHLGVALLGASGVTLAFVPALGEVSTIVTLLRGQQVGFGVRLAVEAAVAGALLLPPAIAMGTVFPLAAALAAQPGHEGRDVGAAVVINTLAGAAGSLGATFLLVPWVGVRGAIVLVAVLSALVGGAVVLWTATAHAWSGLAAASALALVGWGWVSRPVVGQAPGTSTMVPQHVVDHEGEYVVTCHREGPTAITEVLVHQPSGRVDVLIDGFVAAGSSASAGYMRLMGALPMVLRPEASRALVICFGTGTTARAVLDHARRSGATVDVVDINPDVFACAPAASPDNEAALAQARVHVEDGRAFLRQSDARFDVITQEPMPPHFAGVAALYSREYYELARARLHEDGVLVQWLPMHLTAPDDARAIVAAAHAVFPETWLALAPEDYTGLLVMSPSPLGPEARAHAQAELGVLLALDPAGVERFVANAPPVTDDRPSLEHNGIDRVLGRYGSAVALLRHNLSLVAAASRDGAGAARGSDTE
jgi:spermidine synthase